MKRYYLDSCIWRDYFEDRKDRFRPLGEWDFMLIKKIVDNNDLVLYSDSVQDELSLFYSGEQIKNLLSIVPNSLLVHLKASTDQIDESVKLSKRVGIQKMDVLHAILARDNKAILVTRDKHFYELSEYLIIKKPEDLIQL
ncbi:MAG: PIN domain-containing protein [archaeon]